MVLENLKDSNNIVLAYTRMCDTVKNILKEISVHDGDAIYLLREFATEMYIQRYCKYNAYSEKELLDLEYNFNSKCIDVLGCRMRKYSREYTRSYSFDNVSTGSPDYLNMILYNVVVLFRGEFYYLSNGSLNSAYNKLLDGGI